jgi:hypothetical protein
MASFVATYVIETAGFKVGAGTFIAGEIAD